MFWFIPATHRVVIAGLLVVSAIAFVLFLVTSVLARRQGRREERRLGAQAAVRHGTGAQEPPATPRDE